MEAKEFNFLLRKKLKNLSKNSPIFFTVNFNFKTDTITVKVPKTQSTYNHCFYRSDPIDQIVRDVYLTLFEKEYPKMESTDGTLYVIDKVNLVHNLILIKRYEAPDSNEVYACKMKIPVMVFLRDYCSNDAFTVCERWKLYTSLISLVYRGEDIYHEV